MLIAGLMVLSKNALLGLGIMLAAGEVPRKMCIRDSPISSKQGTGNESRLGCVEAMVVFLLGLAQW